MTVELWWNSNVREAALFVVAAALLTFEVVFGGGRPAVIAGLSTLLLGSIGLKIEKVRRENGIGRDNS